MTKVLHLCAKPRIKAVLLKGVLIKGGLVLALTLAATLSVATPLA